MSASACDGVEGRERRATSAALESGVPRSVSLACPISLPAPPRRQAKRSCGFNFRLACAAGGGRRHSSLLFPLVEALLHVLCAPPRTLGRRSTGAPGLNEIRHCGKRASRSRDPDVGLIARGVWRHRPHGQGDMVRRVRGISQKLIQEGNWFFAPVIGPHSLRELFLALTERAGAGGAPRLRRADSSVNATDVRACISFLASRRSRRKARAMRAFPARARAPARTS